MSWSQCFRFGPAPRALVQVVRTPRLGHGDTASLQAANPALDERFEHGHAREVLVLGGDQVPVGVVLVGGVEDVGEGLQVRRPLLTVPPVLGREFPLLHGILRAVVEAPQLLLVRDLEPELDQNHSVVDQGAFELDDLLTRTLRRVVVNQLVNALNEQSSVPGAVVDGHLTHARDRGLEAPEEMVAQFTLAWRTDGHHAHVTRVHARDEVANRPALAGGVEPFEEYEQSGACLLYTS